LRPAFSDMRRNISTDLASKGATRYSPFSSGRSRPPEGATHTHLPPSLKRPSIFFMTCSGVGLGVGIGVGVGVGLGLGLGLGHLLHHHPIVLLLRAALLRWVVQVALRVDAQLVSVMVMVTVRVRGSVTARVRVSPNQVASHREGHGDRVARHAVASDEDGRRGEARVGLVQEQGEDLRVRFRLVVGEEDDVLAGGELLLHSGNLIQPARHLVRRRVRLRAGVKDRPPVRRAWGGSPRLGLGLGLG